jgi:hypothetical protein
MLSVAAQTSLATLFGGDISGVTPPGFEAVDISEKQSENLIQVSFTQESDGEFTMVFSVRDSTGDSRSIGVRFVVSDCPVANDDVVSTTTVRPPAMHWFLHQPAVELPSFRQSTNTQYHMRTSQRFFMSLIAWRYVADTVERYLNIFMRSSASEQQISTQVAYAHLKSGHSP